MASFNPDNVPNPVVKVISPEQIIGLAAQIQDDNISFPLVALDRDEDTGIDVDRLNFTRSHFGVETVIDAETNNLYYEKIIPVKLSYGLTILTTNTADRDELLKELMFKYMNMYYLTIQLPYYCKRKIRFGVSLDTSSEIRHSSASIEYIESGQLYQTILPLRCDGCVMVSYTPVKLKRFQNAVDVDIKK